MPLAAKSEMPVHSALSDSVEITDDAVEVGNDALPFVADVEVVQSPEDVDGFIIA